MEILFVTAILVVVVIGILILLSAHRKQVESDRKKMAEARKNLAEAQRNLAVAEFRQKLIQKLRDNLNKNSAFLLSNHTSERFSEFLIKQKLVWDTWDSITFDTIKNSDKSVEEFYTKEVMDVLLWELK